MLRTKIETIELEIRVHCKLALTSILKYIKART